MTYKTFYLFILLFALIGCEIQNNAPKYIELGKPFDLDQITFKEPIDTLFSKNKGFYKRVLTKGYFDKVLKREVITDTIGYLYFLDISRNEGIELYILNKKFNNLKTMFFTDEKGDFFGYRLFRSTTDDPKILLNELQEKYGDYEVKIRQDPRLGYRHYQWETEDKIMGLFFSIDRYEPDNTHLYTFVSIKKSVAESDIPLGEFWYYGTLCLSDSCKIK